MTSQEHSLRWFGVGMASAIVAVAVCEAAVAMGSHRGGGPAIVAYAGLALGAFAVVTNAMSFGFGVAALFQQKKFCPWALISALLATALVWGAVHFAGAL